MKLSENDFKNYTAILREELIPAMGAVPSRLPSPMRQR